MSGQPKRHLEVNLSRSVGVRYCEDRDGAAADCNETPSSSLVGSGSVVATASVPVGTKFVPYKLTRLPSGGT